jgi:hypothetical protein
MCVGNKAPQATFWINKQVQALWELAQKCVDKHSPGIKPGTTEILLSTALAQLCVGSHPSLSNAASTDLDFHTTFDAPELDFVCNHEVVVTFKLKSGHFKVAGKDKKFISFVPVPLTSYPANVGG